MSNEFTWSNENFKIDCRFFIGEKPCKFKRECKGCDKYSPMGTRIVIIKLAAMGDVLRTTPLLHRIKQEYPDSHITWVVDPESFDLLKNNYLIDCLLPFDLNTLLRLEVEHFDWMICLEKEERATALAEKVTAKKKSGFGLSPYGTIYPLNEESLYSFLLGVSDHVKFVENKKTYQQFIFEMLGYSFSGEEYILEISDSERIQAERLFKLHNIGKEMKVIGICPGAGGKFANKSWTVDSYIDLIKQLSLHTNKKVVLLGGRREKEIIEYIQYKAGKKVLSCGENTLLEYAAIIDHCDTILCGDTLPMHIAIALKKKVLVLFGPTCEQEIELYTRGTKIVSSINCAPCYIPVCNKDETCMTAIKVDEVYQKLCDLIN